MSERKFLVILNEDEPVFRYKTAGATTGTRRRYLYDIALNGIKSLGMYRGIEVKEITNETLNSIEQEKQKAYVEITDKDIETIKELIDILMNEHGYSKEFFMIRRAKELIAKLKILRV